MILGVGDETGQYPTQVLALAASNPKVQFQICCNENFVSTNNSSKDSTVILTVSIFLTLKCNINMLIKVSLYQLTKHSFKEQQHWMKVT